MTTLLSQLDSITLLEIEKILDQIEKIENAFNKIDLERFDDEGFRE